jgi:hypothetical protein
MPRHVSSSSPPRPAMCYRTLWVSTPALTVSDTTLAIDLDLGGGDAKIVGVSTAATGVPNRLLSHVRWRTTVAHHPTKDIVRSHRAAPCCLTRVDTAMACQAVPALHEVMHVVSAPLYNEANARFHRRACRRGPYD